VARVLFLSLFAGQAAAFVLSPILPRLAQEFSVSVAAAGQLRAIAGLAAGTTAVAMGPLARRLFLRDLILVGLSLVALGSLASSLAPTFSLLAGAQVIIGVGLALVLSGAIAATGEWSSRERRVRVLSVTLMGGPAAAIAGTLVAGLVANVSWRAAWLVVPFAASVVAILAMRSRPREERTATDRRTMRLREALRRPGLAGWAIGELFAYSAWSGVVVYAGALLVRSYGVTPALAALAIGASAAAVFPGNLIARRWVGAHARLLLLLLAVALSVATAAFGGVRPDYWVSAVLLAVLGFLAGGRALAGSAFGLQAIPGRKVIVMSVRTTAQQFGYVLGAGLGGVALASDGYGGLGRSLSMLFLAAAVPHCAGAWRERRPHPDRPAPGNVRRQARSPSARAPNGSNPTLAPASTREEEPAWPKECARSRRQSGRRARRPPG
jgi:DHA1 family inner membrane transport protein